MIYVICRTPQEARKYARQNNIYPRNYHFVAGVEDLKEAEGDVVFTGTFYERKDKFDIAAEVEVGVEHGRLKRMDPDE